MKFSEGNAKLGSNCLVVSRPVGDTCPSSCDFLGNGCYAEHTEKLFPNSRKFAQTNLITEAGKIRSMLMHAYANGKSVRLHERGDFFIDGKLDVKYLQNWIKALEGIKEKPFMWVYTHIYDKRILLLAKLGVVVYASVNSKRQLNKAKKAGFTLFAWGDNKQNFIKRMKGPRKQADTYYVIEGEKFLTCPEQRKGREKVTCTGTPDSVACNYCTGKNGLSGNVLFLMH